MVGWPPGPLTPMHPGGQFGSGAIAWWPPCRRSRPCFGNRTAPEAPHTMPEYQASRRKADMTCKRPSRPNMGTHWLAARGEPIIENAWPRVLSIKSPQPVCSLPNSRQGQGPPIPARHDT
eukprot:4277640-Alexandrium_andersonii.AAC.1